MVRGIIFISLSFIFYYSNSHAQATTSVIEMFNKDELPSKLIPRLSAINSAQNLIKSKDTVAAKKILNETINKLKDDLGYLPRGNKDEIYSLLGAAYELNSSIEDAINAYKSSLSLRNGNLNVQYRLAQIYVNLNRCNLANDLLQELRLRLKSDQAEIYYLLAQCTLKTAVEEANKKSQDEINNKAIALLNSGLKYNQHHLPSLELISDLRHAMYLKETTPNIKLTIESQLIDNLSNIWRLNPEDSKRSLLLSEMLLSKGDPLINRGKIVEAEKILSILANKSNYKNEDAVKLLIDAQIKLGNISKAETTLAEGLKATPKSEKLFTAKKQIELVKGINLSN